MSEQREDLRARVDAIEESYEFFLAYAAQGLPGDRGSKTGGQVRQFLTSMVRALDGLADVFTAVVEAEELDSTGSWADAIRVLERDAEAARAAVALVAAQESVGSQLVDNLNANIHLRALLTDVFLLDEALPAG